MYRVGVIKLYRQLTHFIVLIDILISFLKLLGWHVTETMCQHLKMVIFNYTI